MPSGRDLSGEELNLQDLIRAVKGDYRRGGLRYEDLIARRPYDETLQKYIGPDQDRLEQIVREGINTFLPPETVRGLAVMLRVTEQTIIDACARSLGFTVNRKRSLLEVLIPGNTDVLPRRTIESFIALLNTQVDAEMARREAIARAEAAESGTTPPPPASPAPRKPPRRRTPRSDTT